MTGAATQPGKALHNRLLLYPPRRVVAPAEEPGKSLPGPEAEAITGGMLALSLCGWFAAGDVAAPVLIVAGLFLGAWIFAAVGWVAGGVIVYMRLASIGVPTLLAATLIGVDSNNIIANHLIRFQTPEMAARVVFLGNAAMAISLLVWVRVMRRPKPSSAGRDDVNPFRLALYAAAAVASALLVIPSRGAPIWTAAYASSSASSVLELNILGSITISSLIALVAHAHFNSRIGVRGRRWLIAFSVLLVVLVFTIKGNRAELIMLGTGLGLMVAAIRGWEPSRLTLVACAAAFVLFSAVWGAYRPVASEGTSLEKVVKGLWNGIASGEGQEYEGRQILDLAQASPSQYIYHLFGVIGLIEEDGLSYWSGKSYLQYLEMTPPKSLYPNRPDDLSWLFTQIGETSGGAFPELAEAYLNFGALGVVVIPGFISWVYFRTYRRAMERRTPDAFAWYGVMASLCVRTTLYGTLGFYKGLLAFAILQVCLKISERTIPARSPRQSGLRTWT